MAARGRGLPVACILAATVALLVAAAFAQSGCSTVLISLYPCLDYISGNGTTPTRSCCSQLASVVQSQPQCLCAALGSDSSSLGGISINKTHALELPKACNVETPPASRCNTAGGNAPGAATPTTPAVQTPGPYRTGTADGSKATPTAPYLVNGGASLRGPAGLVLGFAAVAVYAMSAV